MKKLIIIFSLVFLSYLTKAAESDIREFIPLNPKVKKTVSADPFNHLTYQILRNADCKKDTELYNEVNALWTSIKSGEINKEEKKLLLRQILQSYADHSSITPYHLGLVEELGIYEKDIWEKSTLRFGPTVTSLLKTVVVVGIISTCVIMPVAAAVVGAALPPGSYKDTCRDIESTKITSTDSNIKGEWNLLQARCAYDRADHGFKFNSIVLPEGGACGYVHNNNGTLVATDSPYLSLGYQSSTLQNRCPELQGSFTRTCGRPTSSPYTSTDRRIPDGSVCQYTVPDCKMRGTQTTRTNNIYISTVSVKCQGERLENCDGTLVGRKAGESDSQCDYDRYSKSKNEL